MRCEYTQRSASKCSKRWNRTRFKRIKRMYSTNWILLAIKNRSIYVLQDAKSYGIEHVNCMENKNDLLTVERLEKNFNWLYSFTHMGLSPLTRMCNWLIIIFHRLILSKMTQNVIISPCLSIIWPKKISYWPF